MAGALTDTWQRHALRDEYSAKEKLWAERAERNRIETRRDIYLEQSGSDLKIRRFTADREDGPGEHSGKRKAAGDIMAMAASTSSYQANYNNPVTLTVGDEEIELTQGELHEIAAAYRNDVRRRIEEARARGAGAEEMRRLREEQKRADELYDRTKNPGDRQLTDEDRRAINGIIAKSPDLRDFIKGEVRALGGPENTKATEADITATLDRDEPTRSAFIEMSRGHAATSFAASIDDTENPIPAASAGQSFARAAEPAAPLQTASRDTPAPDALQNKSGLDLG